MENIEVGKFVVVHLVNYDKVPVVGNVLEVNEEYGQDPLLERIF